MAALTVEELRAIIAERVKKAIERGQNRPGDKVPPPQLLEAMIDLETGGNLDPAFVDPASGAIGLGNIMPDGLEWGIYKANHPDAKESDLTDPAVNIDVMIDGLSYRQYLGQQEKDAGGMGAYADWYMTAAGYLGGANNAGFNTKADAYGTTGESYVRRVRAYITRVWSAETAREIDLLQPGAAVAAGGDWGEGKITFDPDAPTGSTDYFGNLLDSFKDGLSDVYESGKDYASGLLGDIQRAVADEIKKAIGGIIGAISDSLPRVGLAVGGLALAIVGFVVLFRGQIVSATPAGRALQIAKGASGG